MPLLYQNHSQPLAVATQALGEQTAGDPERIPAPGAETSVLGVGMGLTSGWGGSGDRKARQKYRELDTQQNGDGVL